MGHQRMKVIYIAGCGRSGSTLLGRMLGQLDGGLYVGEMRKLWTWCFEPGWLCSCGDAFRDCSFWEKVFGLAYGGWDVVPHQRAVLIQQKIDRARYLPFLLSKSGNRLLKTRIHSLTEILQPLYDAIKTVSGAEFIVDASKDPTYAMILASMRNIDLRVVHLVRHPCGVVWSMMKKRRREDVQGGTIYMGGSTLWKAAAYWTVWNRVFMHQIFSGALVIRYEDVVEAPRDMLARIMEFAGFPALTEVPFITGGRELLLPHDHSASGNPMRVAGGRLVLRGDDEWNSALARDQKEMIRKICGGTAARFRYSFDAPSAKGVQA